MLTNHETQHREHRSTSRYHDPRHIVVSRLEFEDFDDFAGDVAAVTRTIERDGLIAPEHDAFGVA